MRRVVLNQRAKKLKNKLIYEFEGGEIADTSEVKKANNFNESTLRNALKKAINKNKKKPIDTSCLIPKNVKC
jgi:hypothetical protein